MISLLALMSHETVSVLEAVNPLGVISSFAHSVARHVMEKITLLLKMETVALANNASVSELALLQLERKQENVPKHARTLR